MATTHKIFKFVKDNIGQFEVGGRRIEESGRVGSLLQAFTNNDALVMISIHNGFVHIRSGIMMPSLCKLYLRKHGLSSPTLLGNQRYYKLTKAQREELHDIVGMLAI